MSHFAHRRQAGPPGPTPGDRTINVVQGDYKISKDPQVVISTILGSCVAACIYDDRAKVGGLNHFLLPGGGAGSGRDQLKYGSMAMELLINELLKAGADRKSLKAKVFGGARIAAGLTDIGPRNAAYACDYLRREGFPLIGENIGGSQARRIYFRPATGDVRVVTVAPSKTRPNTPPPPPKPPKSDVTLF